MTTDICSLSDCAFYPGDLKADDVSITVQSDDQSPENIQTNCFHKCVANFEYCYAPFHSLYEWFDGPTFVALLAYWALIFCEFSIPLTAILVCDCH